MSADREFSIWYSTTDGRGWRVTRVFSEDEALFFAGRIKSGAQRVRLPEGVLIDRIRLEERTVVDDVAQGWREYRG